MWTCSALQNHERALIVCDEVSAWTNVAEESDSCSSGLFDVAAVYMDSLSPPVCHYFSFAARITRLPCSLLLHQCCSRSSLLCCLCLLHCFTSQPPLANNLHSSSVSFNLTTLAFAVYLPRNMPCYTGTYAVCDDTDANHTSHSTFLCGALRNDSKTDTFVFPFPLSLCLRLRFHLTVCVCVSRMQSPSCA